MKRKTSIQAFNAIQLSGRLGDLQKLAYRVLYLDGPLTGQEIARKALTSGLWKRLSELKRIRAVQEVGKKTCSVTGRQVIAWDVTARVDFRAGSKSPRLSKKDLIILRLEAEVRTLQAEINHLVMMK